MRSSSHELAKFLAGAAAWDTIIHIMLHYSKLLPLSLYGITWTETFNMYHIIISGLITIALVWYAWYHK